MQLYQAALARTPSQSEINGWASSGLPIGVDRQRDPQLVGGDQRPVQHRSYRRCSAPGPKARSPPTTRRPSRYEYHRGGREEELLIPKILASQANYAAANYTAGYVQGLYRDILHRVGSVADLNGWLTQLDQGSVALGSLAYLFLNSLEARDRLRPIGVQRLPRPQRRLRARCRAWPTTPTARAWSSILISSPEYYSRNGGHQRRFRRRGVTATWPGSGSASRSSTRSSPRWQPG